MSKRYEALLKEANAVRYEAIKLKSDALHAVADARMAELAIEGMKIVREDAQRRRQRGEIAIRLTPQSREVGA